MDDKTFELLEKMYAQFTDFRNDMNDFRKETNTRLAKIETAIDHDVKPSLQALHERAAGNTEKLDEHSRRLETVENKLDYLALSVNSQDKRLELVESSKRRKAK